MFGIGAFARSCARYGRLTAAGLGMSCVVIGHASSGADLTLTVLIGLILVGLAFHVVAFALNDLFDLDVDRTDPTRAASPLVAGAISPRDSGIVIGALAVASFVIDTLFFGPATPRGDSAGTVALAVGYAGLVVYDAISKRLPVPLLADLIQGVGWAALVWYGAVRGGGAGAGTVLCGLFVIGFVVIVNAVHGGLRDLRNDSARGARTTAIVLGARLDGDTVVIPLAVRALAWALQLGLAGLALVAFLGVRSGLGWWLLWYAVALATTAAAMLLQREALRAGDDPVRVKNLGAAHILALWLPLTAMTAMYGGAVQGLAAMAAMTVPTLGNASFRQSFRALPAASRDLVRAVGQLRGGVMLAIARRTRRPDPREQP